VNDLLASGGGDGVVKVWDLKSDQPLLTLTIADEPLSALSWSSDGTELIAGIGGFNSDETFQVLDLATGEKHAPPGSYLSTITGFVWSNNSQVLALKGTIMITLLNGSTYDSPDSVQLTQPELYDMSYQLTSIAWSPDDHFIVGGDLNGLIRIWDVSNKSIIRSFHTSINQKVINGRPLSMIQDLYFIDQDLLVITTQGGTVAYWSINEDTHTVTLLSKNFIPGMMETMSYSPYHGRMAVSRLEADNNLRYSQIYTPTAIKTLGSIQILVPDASLTRLEHIFNQCVPKSTQENFPTINDLPDFITRVKALPPDAIPPACTADLIAVAQALIAP
jgi:WD40 repeat protein